MAWIIPASDGKQSRLKHVGCLVFVLGLCMIKIPAQTERIRSPHLLWQTDSSARTSAKLHGDMVYRDKKRIRWLKSTEPLLRGSKRIELTLNLCFI